MHFEHSIQEVRARSISCSTKDVVVWLFLKDPHLMKQPVQLQFSSGLIRLLSLDARVRGTNLRESRKLEGQAMGSGFLEFAQLEEQLPFWVILLLRFSAPLRFLFSLFFSFFFFLSSPVFDLAD